MSSLRMTGEGKGAENRFGHCYQSRKRFPWINSNASVNQAAPVHHPLTPRITPQGAAFFFSLDGKFQGRANFKLPNP